MTQNAKKLRQANERTRRALHGILPKVFMCIQLAVGDDKMREWVVASDSFIELLRYLANNVIGNEDSSTDNNPWITGLCCMFTDLAEIEKIKEDIDTPKKIFLWFTNFCEEKLSKTDLKWGTSKIFSEKNIDETFKYRNKCRITHNNSL